MAILYVFSVIRSGDQNVTTYPPNVEESEWNNGYISWLNKNAISVTDNHAVVIFANQADLENMLNTYRITDPTMLADINAWKTTHNISYQTLYYELSDASISPTPPPIIS